MLYDAENRLVLVSGPSLSASFVYDGNGRRLQATVNGVTTTFVGNHYEVTGGTVTKYYYAGAQRVAMRVGNTLSYLFSDHLGSTSLTTDASGNRIAELRYKPWGEVRYADGATPTDYQFTGQYSHMGDFGLYFFNARWYDSSLGRFAQADSIIPQGQGVQAWDRYAFVNNNPLRYTDPTGHRIDDGCGSEGCDLPPIIEEPDNEDDDDQGCHTNHLCGVETNLYEIGWQNFGQAWSIFWNPNATMLQKAGAYWYMGAWGGSHGALVAGTVVLGTEAIAPGALTCAINPSGCEKVFWSGGKEALAEAIKYAKANNGITLNQTFTGRWLSIRTYFMSWENARPIWDRASAKFAEGASGNVTAFVDLKLFSDTSVYNMVEVPILINNPLVTLIEKFLP